MYSILQNIRMSNFVVVKWQPYKYKTNFEEKKHKASFAWRQDCPISSTTNVTKLSKAILENSHKVLQVKSK